MRKRLGVNIDHIATLRQVRQAEIPDPVQAAVFAELGGADGITVHLREDRRHIQDRDVYLLRKTIKSALNLEMAIHPKIVEVALGLVPDEVCIVPEKREEITTEGGLDVLRNLADLKIVIQKLRAKNIQVSLFIDALKEQIKASQEAGADKIEIHTGRYALAEKGAVQNELGKIVEASKYASSLGLCVNAGHGLNYANVYPIAKIQEIETLNIGHSIVARAVFTGLERAVRDMVLLLEHADKSSGN
jgi:pyridoxine 5-phosphate synthase